MNQSSCLCPSRFFMVTLCLFIIMVPLLAQEESKPRSLDVGSVYLLKTDAHSGDMASTEPKTDANDGRNGDNPYYIRHHVARAHLDYWYSSKNREKGEPDPNGEQWVEYRPPIEILGAGRYSIRAQYREGRNRAPYPAVYLIQHQNGKSRIEKVQNIPATGGLVWLDLGRYELGKGDFIRVVDTGAGSISFGYMEFTFLGPSYSAFEGEEEEIFKLPVICELHGNFPNPFNAGTLVQYTLYDGAMVNLAIYDLLGRKQATLIDEQQSPGFYSIPFNPLEFSSGTYFIHLSVGYMHLTSKMLYMK